MGRAKPADRPHNYTDDGLDHTATGPLRNRGRDRSVTIDDTVRYVALIVDGGRHGAAVRRLSVSPG